VDEVYRAGLPPFKLRTKTASNHESHVSVRLDDLENAYKVLPPHITMRHKHLEDLTDNHEAAMAGAMETREGYLTSMVEWIEEEEAGAHRRADGSEEAASKAGLAFLLGAFDKEREAEAERAAEDEQSAEEHRNHPKPQKPQHHYWEPLKRDANASEN
jgi:hypothetical protein